MSYELDRSKRVRRHRRRRLHRRPPRRRAEAARLRARSAPSTSSRSGAGISSTTASRTSPPTCARKTLATRQPRVPTYVFNLAADMGGMGFIETHKADCMVSVLINTNMLLAVARPGVERFIFGSSACVYAAGKQTDPNVTALTEADAYPAMPEDGYGWEKLFSERMCRHFMEDYGISVRVPRFHNVYGPYGTYDGRPGEGAGGDLPQGDRGAARRHERRSRSGATASRRAASRTSTTRSRGSSGSWRARSRDPINLGSSQLVTINGLVDIVEGIAGVKLERNYNLSAPQGVRGRNSDNTLILEQLGWEPSISLEDGLAKTYAWIHEQMTSGARDEAALAFQGS